MLTFVSGWRSEYRDRALLNQRDPARRAIFFIDNQSSFPKLLPHVPITELWRHGSADFVAGEECETLVRLNHDTDNQLLVRTLSYALVHHRDNQLVVTYDGGPEMPRFFAALRHVDALVASDARLDAPSGDRVVFTKGGSFRWRDHLIESQTALLTEDETVDAGIVPETSEDEYFDYLRQE